MKQCLICNIPQATDAHTCLSCGCMDFAAPTPDAPLPPVVTPTTEPEAPTEDAPTGETPIDATSPDAAETDAKASPDTQTSGKRRK